MQKSALFLLLALLPSCGRTGFEIPDPCNKIDCGDHSECQLNAQEEAVCNCISGWDLDDNGNCTIELTPCKSAADCDDNNPCSNDRCLDGICDFSSMAPNDQACDDQNNCTENDKCNWGECRGIALDCDDQVDCTDDSCDPTGNCINLENNQFCDDYNVCNGTETCNAQTGCESGNAINCDDNISCTDDSCDPVSGCSNTANDSSL